MSPSSSFPRIFILSGGIGASGEQLVHTVLAQFPPDSVQVHTHGNLRHPEQVTQALEQAHQTASLVVHTLVDPALRAHLELEACRLQVQTLDLMGPLLSWVTQQAGQMPKGQPGLYRQLRREYFDRVSAIDYSLAHDDGKNPEGWPRAEALLVGVSRVGKTPLSLYLAVLGWKVANYPLVPQVPPPQGLFALNPERVFGLTVEPGQLLQYRQRRQSQLGAPGTSAYVNPQAIYEEVEAARQIFRRGHFTVVDMTDKTIEQGADEIIRHLARAGKTP